MEPLFKATLLDSGVDEAALEILVEQKISNKQICFAMKEDHIVRLLECHGMAIGSHVLLWEIWENNRRNISSASGLEGLAYVIIL